MPANSPQALDVLMSTMRIASIRGFGGSIPNSRGGSPLSTQRQNLRSAVTMRCWYSGSAWAVISTHLPPPVITDSTADFAATTHMLCCSCGMCFSAAASSENDHGSMNLDSKTAPGALNSAVQGGCHPLQRWVFDMA